MVVSIPTPLFSYTKNKGRAEAFGENLDALMWDLDRQFPGLRFRIINEQDQIRPHIKVFVNRIQVKDLNASLSTQDEVAIVQAFSGG